MGRKSVTVKSTSYGYGIACHHRGVDLKLVSKAPFAKKMKNHDMVSIFSTSLISMLYSSLFYKKKTYNCKNIIVYLPSLNR